MKELVQLKEWLIEQGYGKEYKPLPMVLFNLELKCKQMQNEITNLKLKGATEAYYQMKGKENG